MLSPDTVLQSRYRVVRQLGQGGMGTVYEAIDMRFDNQVALKETHFTEEAMRKQFEREARLLNRLRHPALARVIDHFTEGDGQYLVMDFIEGEDLWEMLEKRRAAFPVEDALRWADQLLDALDYLHSQEPPVIHRDIKPQNLKVTGRNQIILLDFGLAKGFAGQISRVTTSGSIFGYTPNYAPLEQIHGTGTDARSDLYALAATLYHLLTGKVPPDALSRAMALTSEEPDPLQPASKINVEVPATVAGVLQRAMSTNPAKRPASAGEMRTSLLDAKKPAQRSDPDAETIILQQATVASPAQEPKSIKPTVEPRPEPASSPARKLPHVSPPSFGLHSDSHNNEKRSRLKWVAGGLAALVIVALVIVYLSSTNVSFSDAKIRIVYTDPHKKDAETAEARLRNMGVKYVDLNRVAGDYGNSGKILYTVGDSGRADYLADTLADIEKLSTDFRVGGSTTYFQPNSRGEFSIFLTR